MKKTQTTQPKRSKKGSTAQKTYAQSRREVVEENDVLDDVQSMETMNGSMVKRKLWIIGLGLVAVIAFVGYKYHYVLTPVQVNGEPIYVWDYAWKLHKQFGSDQLNSMSTELMIRQAVKDAKVTVSQSEIDLQVKDIEVQASASGGLDAVLAAQRLTKDEFRTRIELQLAVKKILADKISLSPAEIEDTYKKNNAFYKGMSEADAKKEITKQLEEQKFQTEVSKWLTDVRSKAKVTIKFPGVETFTQ